MVRARGAACMVAMAAGMAVAGPVTVNIPVDLDRWNYPFASTPGTELEAKLFGTNLAGFDDRDGQMLVGFSTVDAAAPGQAPGSYAVFAARVRVTVSQGDRFVYDPTADSVRTLYDAADPGYIPDSDPGKPVEVFGVGYRGGPDPEHAWAAVSGPATTAYCETCAFFGGPPVAQPAEGCRAAFPAVFDGAGVATDVSRQVRLRMEAPAMAVGQAALTPGQLVPAGTELVFELNVCDPATRAYLQRGLSEGRLNLMVTTLLRASGPGATDYPVLFTRENPLAGPAQRPRLEMVVNQGRRSDINADGNLNVLDFNAFLNAFGTGSMVADMDNSCALNVLDFNAFLNAFSAGR